MAYIRTGRAVRAGRVQFVPGAVACAALARRFPQSFAPLRFASATEPGAFTANGQGVFGRALLALPPMLP